MKNNLPSLKRFEIYLIIGLFAAYVALLLTPFIWLG